MRGGRPSAKIKSGRPRRENEACVILPLSGGSSSVARSCSKEIHARGRRWLDLPFVSPAVLWFAHRIPSADARVVVAPTRPPSRTFRLRFVARELLPSTASRVGLRTLPFEELRAVRVVVRPWGRRSGRGSGPPGEQTRCVRRNQGLVLSRAEAAASLRLLKRLPGEVHRRVST